MKLQVVDFHCDVLFKMMKDKDISFEGDARLDVTYDRLKQGGIALQVFAIYLSQQWGTPRFEMVLEQMDYFRQKVMPAADGVSWLRWREQLSELRSGQGPAGLLSLEGVDGLEGNLHYVRLCHDLGVRFMGITWNYANWAADGILEQRNGGFTEKGRSFIELCNELGMLLDVSHLSIRGFWELTELSTRPFIASHSNAYTICGHPRNLRDDQIKAIIAMDGRIGITFVPWFVKNDVEQVNMAHILPHIEHICEQGGSRHIMFGSDFDGIDQWVNVLEHPGRYEEFADLLLKHYKEEDVRSWLSGNAWTYLEQHLPSKPL